MTTRTKRDVDAERSRFSVDWEEFVRFLDLCHRVGFPIVGATEDVVDEATGEVTQEKLCGILEILAHYVELSRSKPGYLFEHHVNRYFPEQAAEPPGRPIRFVPVLIDINTGHEFFAKMQAIVDGTSPLTKYCPAGVVGEFLSFPVYLEAPELIRDSGLWFELRACSGGGEVGYYDFVVVKGADHKAVLARREGFRATELVEMDFTIEVGGFSLNIQIRTSNDAESPAGPVDPEPAL
jgi:hypothetical protein